MTSIGADNSSYSTRLIVYFPEDEEESKFLLSYHVLTICYWVIYTGLCQTISIFGVLTNIINIICFVKQGFKESVNVSLLGMSLLTFR
ncbi:unnamed protein product, partial [Candidula unifasciata]